MNVSPYWTDSYNVVFNDFMDSAGMFLINMNLIYLMLLRDNISTFPKKVYNINYKVIGNFIIGLFNFGKYFFFPSISVMYFINRLDMLG